MTKRIWGRLVSWEIPATRGLTFGEMVSALIHELDKDHLRSYAGNLAFRGFLAIFGALVILFSVMGIFGAKDLVDALVSQVSSVVPEPAIEALRSQVLTTAKESSSPGGFYPALALLGALYTLSATARGVIDGLNKMMNFDEKRPLLKRGVVSVTMALVVLILLMVALLLIVAGSSFGEAVSRSVGLSGDFALVFRILRWPALIALVLFAYALVYYYAPAERVDFKAVSHGSVIALPLWLIGSKVFAVMVESFGSFEETYGALAGVVVLMFYMFFSSYVLFIGAEINDVVDRNRKGRKLRS
ncbi:MAG: YihY/virulence factor BrkB family protein [Actinomycetota bacterium]